MNLIVGQSEFLSLDSAIDLGEEKNQPELVVFNPFVNTDGDTNAIFFHFPLDKIDAVARESLLFDQQLVFYTILPRFLPGFECRSKSPETGEWCNYTIFFKQKYKFHD